MCSFALGVKIAVLISVSEHLTGKARAMRVYTDAENEPELRDDFD